MGGSDGVGAYGAGDAVTAGQARGPGNPAVADCLAQYEAAIAGREGRIGLAEGPAGIVGSYGERGLGKDDGGVGENFADHVVVRVGDEQTPSLSKAIP